MSLSRHHIYVAHSWIISEVSLARAWRCYHSQNQTLFIVLGVVKVAVFRVRLLGRLIFNNRAGEFPQVSISDLDLRWFMLSKSSCLKILGAFAKCYRSLLVGFLNQ